MAQVTTLRAALIQELRDIYSAEQQLLQVLTRMEHEANHEQLRKLFHDHVADTRVHIDRLNQIAQRIKTTLMGRTCLAMQGLVQEAEEALKRNGACEELHDALIIASAQRFEHYEIAAYSAARALAAALEEDDVAELLDQTLAEESAAEEHLSEIVEEEILPELVRASEPQRPVGTP